MNTDSNKAFFSENQFWQIIDGIDWSKNTEDEKLQPAVNMLAEMPLPAIYSFADKLAEKLYLLDTMKHAEAHTKNVPNRFLSVDGFLYARCAVVAEGEEYYNQVLGDPTQMPEDIGFESLLNLAEEAYRLKTGGQDYDYHSEIWYETFSNPDGWPGITPLKERIMKTGKLWD